METQSEATARKLAMQLKLRHLRVILALEDALSVTAAADRLNVSAAAVSKALGEIEALVGAELFERSSRLMGLTEAGSVLARHARAIVAQVDHAAEAMATLSLGLSGTLRLASTTVSAQPSLAATMESFRRTHPHVLIQFVMESNVDLAIAQLLQREIDLLFSYADHRLEGQDLATDTLVEEQKLFVVACRTHPLVRPRARPSLRQVRDATWCLPAPASRLRHHFEGIFRDAGHPFPSMGYVSSDLSMIINLMRNAGCLALVPDQVKRELVQQGLATPLAFDTGRYSERVQVAWHAGVQPRAATLAFRGQLRSVRPT